MRRSQPILIRCAAVFCTGLFVVWGLWQSQRPGRSVDDGCPFTYPPTYSRTTKHGWPMYCVLRHESGPLFTPSLREITHKVKPYGLAANIVAWAALVGATVYISWRARARFALTSILSATAVIALLFSLWRLECARYTVPDQPVLTRCYLLIAETPLLRLLHFPSRAYIPTLFGVVCLGLSFNVIVFRILRQAMARLKFGSVLANNEQPNGLASPNQPGS